MRILALIGCLAGPAVASDAGSRFYAPDGCAEKLTVQSRSCLVSNYWTCPQDAQGDQWSIDFELDGPVHLSRIDAEGQWVESYGFSPFEGTFLEQPAKDPQQLSELFETGVDTADFVLVNESERVHFKGFDRLLGEEVVIDGEVLLRTEYSVRRLDENGTELWRRSGEEYVSTKHRRFFGGVDTWEADGRSGTVDRSPVEFIYPGEDGFFTKYPKYDCDGTLARFVPARKGS